MNALAAAQQAGVGHFVLLSAICVQKPLLAFQRAKLAFEAAQMVVPGQPWRLALTTRNLTQLHAWAYKISLTEWQALAS